MTHTSTRHLVTQLFLRPILNVIAVFVIVLCVIGPAKLSRAAEFDPGEFRAMLNDGTFSLYVSFDFYYPIYSSGGNYLADGFLDFFDGHLDNAVEHNEFGQSLVGTSERVWTGSDAQGLSAPADCISWQTEAYIGTTGNPLSGDEALGNFDFKDGTELHRLYGVSQGQPAMRHPALFPGHITQTTGAHIMFATSTTHSGNLGGIAGGNAIVQARAAEAGLVGQGHLPGWTIRSFDPVMAWTEAAGGSFEDLGNWDKAIPVLEQDARFDLNATYTVEFGYAPSHSKAILTDGDVTFNLGGNTYSLDTSVEISNGALSVTNGTLDSPVVSVLAGGALGGNGSITGVVNNGGTISPGMSPGTLTIDGDLVSTAGSLLSIEIGGTAGTEYDQLLITGDALLNGELAVELVDNFIPSPSDFFTILASDSLAGAFTNVADGGSLEILGGGGSFLVSYDGTSNTVSLSNFTAVPEPSGFSLLAIAMVSCTMVRLIRGPRAGATAR